MNSPDAVNRLQGKLIKMRTQRDRLLDAALNVRDAFAVGDTDWQPKALEQLREAVRYAWDAAIAERVEGA